MAGVGGRRLVYYVLLRTVVTTLLMFVAFLVELAEPSPGGTPTGTLLFVLIGASYASTLAVMLLVRRGKDTPWLARVQLLVDVVSVSILVWVTGGADSSFVFLFLLMIVGASSTLSGLGLAILTAGCALAYAAVVLGLRSGMLPPPSGTAMHTIPLGAMTRILAINIVAFVATAALARRLVSELERAGARIEAEGTRLRDLAKLHEEVLDSLQSGLLTVAHDGRVASCNGAAREILGLSDSDIVGRVAAEILPGMPPVEADGRLRRGEMLTTLPDGTERYIGVSISPLVSRAGDAVGRVINFQDLTELRKMRQQVERAERLAAIGRLAAGVAHEIRNPLAAISGSIELLRDTVPADAEGHELMGIVLREIERLDGLIRELLVFARPAPPQPAPVELGAAVRELAQVAAQDPKLGGHALEVSVGDAVWTSADPSQLRQVLWNLVRNAAEASPAGAPVAISTSLLSEGERRYARVSVRDRGPGIAEEERGKLFEPFFSTKKGGTGLGLAVVHRIVEEHQGRVEVRAADGGGTEFAVLLPPCEPPA